MKSLLLPLLALSFIFTACAEKKATDDIRSKLDKMDAKITDLQKNQKCVIDSTSSVHDESDNSFYNTCHTQGGEVVFTGVDRQYQTQTKKNAYGAEEVTGFWNSEDKMISAFCMATCNEDLRPNKHLRD